MEKYKYTVTGYINNKIETGVKCILRKKTKKTLDCIIKPKSA